MGRHRKGILVSKEFCFKIDKYITGKYNTYLILTLNKTMSTVDSPNKVTCGQGEYIVFYHSPDGQKQTLSKEDFDKVYTVFLEFSAKKLLENLSPEGVQSYINRYENIRERVKLINKALEINFIPRTLYELVLVEQCIVEEMTTFCLNINPKTHEKVSKAAKALSTKSSTTETNVEKQQQAVINAMQHRLDNGCWHRKVFRNTENDDDPEIINIAYRLNAIMVELFNSCDIGFTEEELIAHTKKQLLFLQSHRNAEPTQIKKYTKEDLFGLAVNFYYDCEYKTRDQMIIPGMGIGNAQDAHIITAAVALEYSKKAHEAFLIYRGAILEKESILSQNESPHSLSYGTSLLAGSLFDRFGTAWSYMKQSGCDAFAISIPFDQLYTSPFHIPVAHTISQFLGKGEIFHARSKIWNGFTVDENTMIDGIYDFECNIQHLVSFNLSKEDLVQQFKNYMINNVTILKNRELPASPEGI